MVMWHADSPDQGIILLDACAHVTACQVQTNLSCRLYVSLCAHLHSMLHSMLQKCLSMIA